MGDTFACKKERLKNMAEIFIEAESFKNLGGWVIDQQSMETIHSSYIMAHGMGVPVADAVHEFEVNTRGEYTVWVFTRDWTAVWDVKNPAGKFKIGINGVLFDTELGTNGKDWAWQKAGKAELFCGKNSICLHDLTGFNGRCDAVYLTTEDKIPEDTETLRKRLNWKEIEDTDEEYDLIVVGGGIAGVCTALSALRSGVKVCLINDRGVLGGCNSSEIRVCMGGMINLPPYEKIGNIVREIGPIMGDPSIYKEEYFEDARKILSFENQRYGSNTPYKILLNECVTDIECDGKKITAVICTNTVTGKKTKYRATLFSDCSGDAVLARLGGAEVMYGREPSSKFNESLAPKTHEKLVMGHSIRWYSEKSDCETEFPDIDWNLNFNEETFLNCYSGDWEQETGFTRNMVSEIEYIRDYGLRAIYSNWSYQKNHYPDRERFAKSTLKWVSALGGKRESYRVRGDYIITQNDIENHTYHEDGTACITWSIDMHFPEPTNLAQFGEAFRSFAYHRGIVEPYPIPYRCLYSKDIQNLFLGGRLVSSSHVAFSAIRVMRTLGELGEVVGLASAICKKHDCMPREVYSEHLAELKELLQKGVDMPAAFECGIGSEEQYHFKDIGWLNLHPYIKVEDKDKREKFKRGIKSLNLSHKYPLPEEFK